jgi:energy-coupling factor transport system permease protein
VSRSHYRPDPWRWPEWVVTGCGLASAIGLCLSTGYNPAALNPSLYPLHWPSLPLIPAVAILTAALAAVCAPPPPSAVKPHAAVAAAPPVSRVAAGASL